MPLPDASMLVILLALLLHTPSMMAAQPISPSELLCKSSPPLPITVNEALTRRASAIAFAPSAPILLANKLSCEHRQDKKHSSNRMTDKEVCIQVSSCRRDRVFTVVNGALTRKASASAFMPLESYVPMPSRLIPHSWLEARLSCTWKTSLWSENAHFTAQTAQNGSYRRQ